MTFQPRRLAMAKVATPYDLAKLPASHAFGIVRCFASPTASETHLGKFSDGRTISRSAKGTQNWNFCMLEPMHHTDFTNYPRYISWQSFSVSSLQKSSLSKAWCNHWFLSGWKSTWDSPTHLCFEVVELHSLIPGFLVNVVHRRPCCEIGLKWDAWDTTKTHATWTWWEKMWFASVALQ